METSGLDAGAGAWKRCRENDGVSESKGVGRVRLGGINVDPLVAGEWSGVKPGAVGKEGVAAEMRDGGFEMKAAGDGSGDDFIVVLRKNAGELADAFGVAALSEADEQFSADAKDVPAFESAGKRNIFEPSKF